MGKNLIETVMGAVVLLVAGSFMFFAYQSSGMKKPNGYEISARFENVAGLATGSDVRIGGIKVGVVSEMLLDNNTYQAIVKMQLKPDAKIPKDSSASVVGDGLLGSKYVAIEPGGDDAMLKAGSAITITQPSVNIEQLIGKFMFSGGGVDKEKKAEE